MAPVIVSPSSGPHLGVIQSERFMKTILMCAAFATAAVIGVQMFASDSATGEPAGKPSSGPSSQPASRPASQPASAPASRPAGPPQVVIATNFGDITLELDPQRAPKTVANFLAYVDEGFYKDVLFHRVMRTFMIQGGGVTADLQPKQPTRPPVVNESQHTAPNTRGTVAMARTDILDSATSQFFINTADNESLNHGGQYGGYAVFGKVTAGMDVVEKIAAVRVRPTQISNAQPIDPVIIKSITRKAN